MAVYRGLLFHFVGEMEQLPDEVIVNILSYVSFGTNVLMSKTCKRLNLISKDDELWLVYAKRLYKNINLEMRTFDPICGWMERFKMLMHGYLTVRVKTIKVDFIGDKRRVIEPHYTLEWSNYWDIEADHGNRDIVAWFGPFKTPERGLLFHWTAVENRKMFEDNMRSKLNVVCESLLDIILVMAGEFGVSYSWGHERGNYVIKERGICAINMTKNKHLIGMAIEEFFGEHEVGYYSLVPRKSSKRTKTTCDDEECISKKQRTSQTLLRSPGLTPSKRGLVLDPLCCS